MSKPGSPYRYMSWVTGLGITMITCTGVGLYIGIFLDARLNSSPWCSLVCSILGMVSGGMAVYKGIMRDMKNSE